MDSIYFKRFRYWGEDEEDLFACTYPKREINTIGQFAQFVPSSKNCVAKCLNTISWIWIVVGVPVIINLPTASPIVLFGSEADYNSHFGAYFLYRFGSWYNPEWFKEAATARYPEDKDGKDKKDKDGNWIRTESQQEYIDFFDCKNELDEDESIVLNCPDRKSVV